MRYKCALKQYTAIFYGIKVISFIYINFMKTMTYIFIILKLNMLIELLFY